jgi:LysM repeat protein
MKHTTFNLRRISRFAASLIVLAGLMLTGLLLHQTPASAATNTPTRTATATPTRTPTATPTRAVTYVVQWGDQLLKIARRFGVTLSALKAANNLKDDTIYVGEILIIPAPAPTATPKPTIPPDRAYVVQPGDQLLRIARKFGVTLSALKSANGLTSDVIVPGQVLYIPTPPPPTATPKPTATLSGNNVYYTVQTGDTLTRIAAMYGVTTAAIKSANGLTSDTVRLGRTLLIPNPTAKPIQYTVLAGDTLTSIAKKFNTTADAIKQANRMKTDTIFAGLILIVPSK